MRQWLNAAHLQGRHLEIGTAAGGTLCAIMNWYSDSDRPAFTVVDTMSYFPNQLDIVKANLTEHGLDPQNVDFRVTGSDAAFESAQTNREQFDFILVDASHKIRDITNDLRWLRLLNQGGLACFHDYGPAFPGVRWSVDRFLRRHPHFVRHGQAGNLVCLQKDKPGKSPEVDGFDRAWATLLSPILNWRRSLQKRFKRKARDPRTNPDAD